MKCIVTLQFNVWSISKDKPNLDYSCVIHLVPNSTQTMHSRLQVEDWQILNAATKLAAQIIRH